MFQPGILGANPKREAEARGEPDTEADETEEDTEQPESATVQAMRRQVADLERSRQQADQEKLQEFARKKRAACAAGDTENYDRISREETQFYQNIATRGQQAQQQTDAAITSRWLEKNRWASNSFLRGHAEAIAQRDADKGVTGAAQLKAVEREMRSDPESRTG